MLSISVGRGPGMSSYQLQDPKSWQGAVTPLGPTAGRRGGSWEVVEQWFSTGRRDISPGHICNV